MSAAATAAGYLYASGRLRGRGGKEHDGARPEKPKEAIRVAVLPEPAEAGAEHPAPPAPRRAPKIEYKTRRRWTAP